MINLILFHVIVFTFQPKPQFQPSFKGGVNSSSTSSTKPVEQPLSYAEYIVQSKSNVAPAAQREGPSKLPRAEAAGGTSLKAASPVSSAPGGCETVQGSGDDGHEETQVAGSEQKEGNCQTSDPSLNLGPKAVGSGSSIIVSPRQVCINMCLIWATAGLGLCRKYPSIHPFSSH